MKGSDICPKAHPDSALTAVAHLSSAGRTSPQLLVSRSWQSLAVGGLNTHDAPVDSARVWRKPHTEVDDSWGIEGSFLQPRGRALWSRQRVLERPPHLCGPTHEHGTPLSGRQQWRTSRVGLFDLTCRRGRRHRRLRPSHRRQRASRLMPTPTPPLAVRTRAGGRAAGCSAARLRRRLGRRCASLRRRQRACPALELVPGQSRRRRRRRRASPAGGVRRGARWARPAAAGARRAVAVAEPVVAVRRRPRAALAAAPRPPPARDLLLPGSRTGPRRRLHVKPRRRCRPLPVRGQRSTSVQAYSCKSGFATGIAAVRHPPAGFWPSRRWSACAIVSTAAIAAAIAAPAVLGHCPAGGPEALGP